MTSDEMVRRLQAQFGDIGDITKFVPSDEGGGYVRYDADPALQRKTEFGPGISNIRPAEFSKNIDPLANEYGIIPSEQTATPISYRADLTAPDKEGYYYTADFNPEGAMMGGPKREKYEPDFMRKYGKYALALPVLAALPYAAPGLFAAEGATAAALGELGINTTLAAGTPGGIAAGTSIATPWYEPFAQGFQSLKDVTDVGKFIDGPSWLQQGATSGFRNVLGQAALTGDVDLERALQAAATAGVTGFADPYLSELPKEFQPIAKAGVQTALQGGSAEDVFKGAILGPINETVAGIAGPTAAKVATSAVRGLLSSGAIDASKLTANMLGDFVGSAVAKETGDAFLGKAAATAIRSKGNLEATIKQLAMGALTTPTKKG